MYSECFSKGKLLEQVISLDLVKYELFVLFEHTNVFIVYNKNSPTTQEFRAKRSQLKQQFGSFTLASKRTLTHLISC